MFFKVIPQWLLVAVPCSVAVIAYLHFADDLVGGAFFAMMSAILVYRMARRGVPLTEAMVGGENFSDSVTIQGGIVHFADGEDDWFDSIKNFAGVLWRVERAPRRKTATFHVLELVHRTDPERTIPLFRSPSDYGMRQRWSETALAIGLPALRDTGDGKTLRFEAQDLRCSTRERVGAGRAPDYFDFHREVPEGLDWWHADNRVTVLIRKARWPFLLGLVPVLFLAIMLPDDPITAKILILGLPAAGLLIWMALDYRIDTTPRGMTVRRVLGPLPFPGRHYDLDAVMNVLQVDDVISAVHVETRSDVVKITPLTPLKAIWLQAFLTSVLANAPENGPG